MRNLRFFVVVCFFFFLNMNVFLFEAGDVGPRIAELSIINADSW